MPPPSETVPLMPSSIDQSMPMSWKTLLESSTKRASIYTCFGSTSISRITCSHASRIKAGAVIITEFDSGNAIAILFIFQVTPKSPDQVELSFAATSSAEACESRNVRVDMRRRASEASAFASAAAFSFMSSARSSAAAATRTSSDALAAAAAMTTAFESESSSTSGEATKSAATGSTGSAEAAAGAAGCAASSPRKTAETNKSGTKAIKSTQLFIVWGQIIP